MENGQSAAFALRLQLGRKTQFKTAEQNAANTVSGIGLAKVCKLGKAQHGGLLHEADGRLN